jgi:scyllo-inositol 2-dehydrogenase (NADP+)
VLEAGRDCVVDKVMALSTAEADGMIAARDRSGRMLSVFHNRRWDWDYLTLQRLLAEGRLGHSVVIESAVCRHAAPRTWRGRASEAGTILHDWGAHLVDQALQLGLGRCQRLTAWLTPAPWPGVDSGGHGRIALEFDDLLFHIETSRISRVEKPRFWVVGTEGGLVKLGIDPQEDALRAGNLDQATEPQAHKALYRAPAEGGDTVESVVETQKGSWDAYYANVAGHLLYGVPLAVTAEQGREVVRVLEAAARSAAEHITVVGPWGFETAR